jgi:hypothetical protein
MQEDKMKKGKSIGLILFLLSFAIFVAYSPVHAALIWGTDALSGDLEAGRTSAEGGGITATGVWDNGGFTLSWIIKEIEPNRWQYAYTINVTSQFADTSHFILEVTEDDDPFTIFNDPGDIEGPRSWRESGGNPRMPNDMYGIKFDFGDDPVTYTIVTNRAPVYGVFYAKDGAVGGEDVVAWSNALNDGNYKTSKFSGTTTDFIVRPDSIVPIPSAVWLFGSGIIGLVFIRRKFKK